MKKLCFLALTVALITSAFAQQKTFDGVTYTPPKDWTEKQSDGNISYSRIDGGSWAQIVLYNHRNSEGAIQADFDKDWNELVTQGKNISAPEKTAPTTSGGWTVISGSGVWQYNGANVATLLTVYSNNKICVSVLCNATAKPYLKDYQTLIGSLNLDASTIKESAGAENNAVQPVSAPTTANSSIVGAWINFTRESRGFINGYNMYTGGYMKKEYLFNGDGTYIFRQKDWMAVRDNIYFVYETGKWSVNGNKLTITPTKGKAEWWLKDNVGNNVDKWGPYQKAGKYTLETVTYAIEFETGSYSRYLKVSYGKPTQRDGDHPADNGQYTSYVFDAGKSIIDYPPGFKN
ncbi:MAG: hypothetical protein JST69_09925 [Bacteroidetes bacterium]|nr:hypothetical protein [Bacteroidota bacterium]